MIELLMKHERMIFSMFLIFFTLTKKGISVRHRYYKRKFQNRKSFSIVGTGFVCLCVNVRTHVVTLILRTCKLNDEGGLV